MSAIIFDGRAFATKKEEELKKDIDRLKKKGVTPKLVSILIGDDPASRLYSNLKQKAAKRIGAEMEIREIPDILETKYVIAQIKNLNLDPSVHGIMVQLPLPEPFFKDTDRIIKAISREKDVDGMRKKSDFIPATVKAIIQIIEVAKKALKHDFVRVAIVGNKGKVGAPLEKLLNKLEYRTVGVDKEETDLTSKIKFADLIISATGQKDLIKDEMVREETAFIDVGAPDPEINHLVYLKAAFYTPVPGGVGPVTVVSLLDNLVIATKTLV